jgi:hypothetical protein
MVLEALEIVNSIFSLITALVFAIIGIYIASKYLKYKNRTLLYLGFAWVFLGCSWWPSSASFLTYIATGKGLSLQLYLLSFVFVPLFLVLFIAALTDMKYKEKRRILLAIFILQAIIWEIYFIYFLVTNPTIHGTLVSPVDINFGTIMVLYLLVVLITAVIIGLLIGIDAFKSKKPEIKLKGKFLIIAFISFLIGAFFDAALPITFVTIPIIRLILISSAFEFYCGYILPDFVKNLFLKEES